MPVRYVKNQEGLTLTEVVVAIVLIMVIGAATAQAYFTGIRVSNNSSNNLGAVTAAQDLMELLQAGKSQWGSIEDLGDWLEGLGYEQDAVVNSYSNDQVSIILHQEDEVEMGGRSVSLTQVTIQVAKEDNSPVVLTGKLLLHKH